MDNEILYRVKNFLLIHEHVSYTLHFRSAHQLTTTIFRRSVKAGKKCTRNADDKDSRLEQAVFECYKQLWVLCCYDLTKSWGAKH